jgi:hypothetical protein
MQNKELVISLIQQDLKHHQLIIGLENISLNAGRKAGALLRNGSDLHLDILDLCFDAMKVPESAEIDWGMTYTNYMNKALRYKIDATSEGLRHREAATRELAELCYTHLKGIVDLENERKG